MVNLKEKMDKLKQERDSEESFQMFKDEVAKHYKEETGDIHENTLIAAYQVLISYKQPACKDHTKPAKFCEDCEELLAKQIFMRIWDLEFDGLDKQLTPEMEKILAKFWETMLNLRREYISDDYWNGGKDV